ncbi:MAG: hypothetical protein CMJ33_09725 [Phycisphaerae bacterium]|nr:hypothetical protein [Phycisphaerae bacterium]
MKKVIVRGSIGIAALILILVLLVMVFINSIAKSAITTAGTSTLGVDTSLDSISIGLFSGHSSIDGVSVANPKGFDGDFLDLSEGVLDVNLSSLLGDVIEVRQIALEGLNVQFVQKIDGSNVSRILDNVNGSTSAGSDKPAENESDPGSSRKFVIDQLKVTNVKVSVAVEPISSATAPSTVTINQIIVKDIGKKKDGADLDQLIAIVVQSVVDAVIKAAPSEIPAIMMQGIEGGLSSLTSFDFGNVQFDGGKGLQDVVRSISGIGKSTGTKDVSDAIEGIGKGIGKGLDDLFKGGEEKKDSSDGKSD